MAGSTPSGRVPLTDPSFAKFSGMRRSAMRPPFGIDVCTSRMTRALFDWNATTRMPMVAFGSSGSAMARVAGRSTSPSGVTRPTTLNLILPSVLTVTPTALTSFGASMSVEMASMMPLFSSSEQAGREGSAMPTPTNPRSPKSLRSRSAIAVPA